MNQDFFTISAEQCRVTVPFIRKNADTHYKSARLLAEKTDYGLAISHLILSSEELVKALIIAIASRGYRIRQIEGIKRFFFKHTPRHEVASMMAIMVPLLPYVKNFMELNSIVKFKNEEIELEVDKNGIPSKESLDKLKDSVEIKTLGQGDDLDKMLVQLQSVSLADEDLYRRRFQFWQKADLLKQEGFYVDYKEVLKSPDMISKGMYNEALDAVDSFNESISAIITAAETMPKFIIDFILGMLKNNPEAQQAFESSILDLSKK